MRLPCAATAVAIFASLATPAMAQMALTQQPPSPPTASTAQTPEREALLQALLAFVLDEYLGNGRSDHVNRADMYAPMVTYYARGKITRAAVMADKAAYYRRWPSRVYAYVPETLRIENAGAAGVTVVFRHSFVVMNGAERRTGIAVTRLGVTLEGGRFAIVREAGAVERKGS